MPASNYEQVVFSLVVWSWVNDQEAGSQESKEGAPRGYHGNDTDTSNSFHYSTQSGGHQDLTDVHLHYKGLYNITVGLVYC